MCNYGAKDNLGQVADFMWLGIAATVCKCPHAGTAAMNDRAAPGSCFNIGEVGSNAALEIASEGGLPLANAERLEGLFDLTNCGAEAVLC
jgi:hypothetical protein